jgi:hypothetical protein
LIIIIIIGKAERCICDGCHKIKSFLESGEEEKGYGSRIKGERFVEKRACSITGPFRVSRG